MGLPSTRPATSWARVAARAASPFASATSEAVWSHSVIVSDSVPGTGGATKKPASARSASSGLPCASARRTWTRTLWLKLNAGGLSNLT